MKDSYKNILIGVLVLAVAYLIWSRQGNKVETAPPVPNAPYHEPQPDAKANNREATGVDELTDEKRVVDYVKLNGRLPDYYLTKNEARKRGWNAGAGNLCDVLPGKAIGGDVFTNRQKLLPVASGRRWYEADLNYDCGRRNADRILFSNDGLVYVTHDHYKTVEKQ